MQEWAGDAVQRHTQKVKEHGVALLAVLWLVAALSIMLTGLQYAVRGEIRVANQVRKSVVSNGLADAAIRLTLRELEIEKSRGIKFVQT